MLLKHGGHVLLFESVHAGVLGATDTVFELTSSVHHLIVFSRLRKVREVSLHEHVVGVATTYRSESTSLIHSEI